MIPGKIKAKVNMVIDLFLLISMMLTTGVGLLIKYVLATPRAAGRNAMDLLYLGMDKHQWGDFHFIVSLVFLGLLALHILFHLREISGIFKRLFPNVRVRIFVGTAVIVISLIVLSFPLFVKPEAVPRERSFREMPRDDRSSRDQETIPEESRQGQREDGVRRGRGREDGRERQ